MSYITGFYKGRLGIGLTPTMGMGDGNPRFPLDINGDIRLTGDIMNENGISLLGSSAQGTFVLTDNNDIVLGNDSYKVGIGTTSPDDKLHVQGGGIHIYCNSAGTGNDAAQGSSAGNANIFMDCNNYSTGAKNGIIWKSKYDLSPNTYTKTSAGIYYQPEENYFRGGLSFYTNGTSNENTDATEKMRIDMIGNVGIGTTSPTTLLQIKGNGDSNNVQLLIENESYNKGIQFQYKSASNTTYNFPQARIWTSGSSYDTKLYFSTAKGSSNSNTVLSTAMTIDYDGNVGIGTTSPDAKLHISDSGSPTLKIVSLNHQNPGIELVRTSLNNSSEL